MYYGYGFHGYAMVLIWLLPLLIVAAMLYYGRGGERENEPSAEEILRRRYARGEIDSREFETRLEKLKKTRAEP